MTPQNLPLKVNDLSRVRLHQPRLGQELASRFPAEAPQRPDWKDLRARFELADVEQAARAFFEVTQDLTLARMLAELVDDTGMQPAELFGDKWDSSDPLARNMYNQNLLAWFGFETAASRLMESW